MEDRAPTIGETIEAMTPGTAFGFSIAMFPIELSFALWRAFAVWKAWTWLAEPAGAPNIAFGVFFGLYYVLSVMLTGTADTLATERLTFSAWISHRLASPLMVLITAALIEWMVY